MSISLVAGLGNPGREYEGSRHNMGRSVVDAYASKHGLSWKNAPRFDSMVTRRDLGPGRTLWLMKPQAYMNESANSWLLTGQAATEQAKFGVSYASIDPFGACP